MSVAEFLVGRHSSRAEIAAETPIFHALATAATPIFYALTTANDAPARRVTRTAESPLHAVQQSAEWDRDSATAPIPTVGDTQPPASVSALTRSNRPRRSTDLSGMPRASRTSTPEASNVRTEQPRRTGRHRLLSPA
jgi:hypothetical protein